MALMCGRCQIKNMQGGQADRWTSFLERDSPTNEHNVSLEVLGKICAALHVNLGDIARSVEL